jgi:hypothetical protein
MAQKKDPGILPPRSDLWGSKKPKKGENEKTTEAMTTKKKMTESRRKPETTM